MSSASPAATNAWAPFRLEPEFVGRVWGYNDLRPWYNKTTEGEPIGEVWLTGDQCRVATGPHAGKTLGELFAASQDALLGPGMPSDGSPLLLKVICAKQKLSVQVHPDDRMARKYGEPRGKTECWYALAAEPGAELAVGLKPGVTLNDVRRGITEETLEQSLSMLSVDPGQMIFVDAGTVHAIWPGSILLETQQNSDLTYRMYDYGRPRPLHIDKSIEAVKFNTRAGKVVPVSLADRTILIQVDYFCVERIPVGATLAGAALPGPDETAPGLAYLFAAAGEGRLEGPGFEPVLLPQRTVVAVPAAAPDFTIVNLGGLDLMRISPRWPATA